MITATVTYTITTTYTFDSDFLLEKDEEQTEETFCRGWIEEDFRRIENRADNVLPVDYTSTLQVDFSAT